MRWWCRLNWMLILTLPRVCHHFLHFCHLSLGQIPRGELPRDSHAKCAKLAFFGPPTVHFCHLKTPAHPHNSSLPLTSMGICNLWLGTLKYFCFDIQFTRPDFVCPPHPQLVSIGIPPSLSRSRLVCQFASGKVTSQQREGHRVDWLTLTRNLWRSEGSCYDLINLIW